MPSAQNICPECGKDYVQKRNLDRHIRSVHMVQGFACEHCRKLFNRSDKVEKFYLMIRGYKNLQKCGKDIVSVRKPIKKKIKSNLKKSLKRLK